VFFLTHLLTRCFSFNFRSFLITLFVKSESDGQRSGGFSQDYYTKSKKLGKKKTNLTAVMKGKGEGMYSDN
jgi:hypothetical protein